MHVITQNIMKHPVFHRLTYCLCPRKEHRISKDRNTLSSLHVSSLIICSLVINACNHAEHYETPCISLFDLLSVPQNGTPYIQRPKYTVVPSCFKSNYLQSCYKCM